MVAVSEPHDTTSVVSQSMATSWLALKKVQSTRATGGAADAQESTFGNSVTHHGHLLHLRQRLCTPRRASLTGTCQSTLRNCAMKARCTTSYTDVVHGSANAEGMH